MSPQARQTALEPSDTQDVERVLLHELEVHYPDASSIVIFGSRATGRAQANSNADVLVFQREPPAGGWGTEQYEHGCFTAKVDVLPKSMLRSPMLFSGTLAHEIFFSTVGEARILRDLDGQFANFAARVREYPSHLRKNVALARVAKFSRAKKVVDKAICQDDRDTLRSFLPYVVEHAAHAVLARRGIYATRNWLSRLGDADDVCYRAVTALYNTGLDKPALLHAMGSVTTLMQPHVEWACRPLVEFAANAANFRQISRRFEFVDVYDLEILVQSLRARTPTGQGYALLDI